MKASPKVHIYNLFRSPLKFKKLSEKQAEEALLSLYYAWENWCWERIKHGKAPVTHSTCWFPLSLSYWESHLQGAITQGLTDTWLQVHALLTLPCIPDVLTLAGWTLFWMVALWSVGIQTLLKSFAYPDPRCLWTAKSHIVTRFIAYTFSEFEMASDLREICHPIARWFKSFQPRIP